MDAMNEPPRPRDEECPVCRCAWHGLRCTTRRYVEVADWRAYGTEKTYRREECGCLGVWAGATA